VESHLNSQAAVSVSIDGWDNQKGDDVKMINTMDGTNNSFLTCIVDDPGAAADAQSYKKALEPALLRHNNVGGTSDNPSVMRKARTIIKHDTRFRAKVMVPCSWHAHDGCAPLSLPFIKTAITTSKKIVKFFKWRHRPKGVLRLKREQKNAEARAGTPKGTKVKHIPTLKVLSIHIQFAH
jgi:hypothetical protein